MSTAVQKLGMPKWGLSMTEGRLIAWLVDEGAEIAVGDEVAEVETEKINGAVEAPVAGVLRRRVAAEGDVIPVGGLLGVVAEAGVPDADVDAFIAEFQASFVPGESEEDAGPQPETATVGAGTLRFIRHEGDGDAEPLVLLHGFGGDLNNWLFNTEALAAGRTVYALDLPGHGESAARDSYSMDEVVDHVHAAIVEAGLQAPVVVGHSISAVVATVYASRLPTRGVIDVDQSLQVEPMAELVQSIADRLRGQIGRAHV